MERSWMTHLQDPRALLLLLTQPELPAVLTGRHDPWSRALEGSALCWGEGLLWSFRCLYWGFCYHCWGICSFNRSFCDLSWCFCQFNCSFSDFSGSFCDFLRSLSEFLRASDDSSTGGYSLVVGCSQVRQECTLATLELAWLGGN